VTGVLVVGAGVVGAAAAYQLARDGVAVTVVDPAPSGGSAPGQATAAAAGIVFPWQFPDVHPALQALGRAAADSLVLLAEQLAGDGVPDSGYARRGAMTVLPDADELAAQARGAAWLAGQAGMTGLGPVELLEPGEPAKRFPALRKDHSGVFAGGVAQVDGRVLRDALLCAATRCGATQVAGRAELVLTGGRVTGVQVDGWTLLADTVVLAAGAWSALLCAPLGVHLPVAPQRGLTVHLHLPGAVDTDRWPAVRGPDNAYLVAFGGGRVVAGASIEANSGYNSSVSSKALHQVLDAALTLAPGLRDAIVTTTAVGLRPISPDGLPLLGAVSNLDGLIVATGLGG
jgi:D-amino-acid dehydrogenase